MNEIHAVPLTPHPAGEGEWRFRVWAPEAEKMELHILDPDDRRLPMESLERGYFEVTVHDAAPGARYMYIIDGEKERPDPASALQPDGVHGPSMVMDADGFEWTDQSWRGLPLEDYILYEIHVGTFTREGTFDGVISRLDELKELGITALEVMPVAQFPEERNWGYDGVYPFAVQNSYGGPDELKRLVNACHRKGMAVVLDVVYNHLGPEGNYLWDYGPYFTNRYQTPWGEAVNFDGAHSDEVRAFFLQNALRWVDEFHFDALRLDALHAIYDFSARTFLEDLADEVHELGHDSGRLVYLIAESDLNNSRLIRPRSEGGFELDAQWSDDFHHALHTLLTGEELGYYMDFGSVSMMAEAIDDGYVYSGRYSRFRQRSHGNYAGDLSPRKFVACIQNHDQVGNRMMGDRLSTLTDSESLKLAAASIILSPYIPLLFMGEEYGETAPFLYFISHTDMELVEAVRKGRKEEFSSFGWKESPPDPFQIETFEKSRLNPEIKNTDWNKTLYFFYKELVRIRKENPSISSAERDDITVECRKKEEIIFIHRKKRENETLLFLNFSTGDRGVDFEAPEGRWNKVIDSAAYRPSGKKKDAVSPADFSSGETVTVAMPKRSAALYVKEA